ncbi:beta-xylosidase [Enterococcus sp. JM4C]|uniref:glycoside hydrolase family 43 protein n=1 Tax=Candidatus Enterococcus huntleyi TaxID=1857217 RepID=UPI00137A30E8|nr:glycoside hydrolase family 43 protein [Enterococcus sp. JM4C]KAF1295208.1 beta-xylosidase [Enterococcus sp. JM4C]
MIINPILKGFNPDPSICKKGDTYYIAVSTFEWFPGVRVYKSNNLKDWTFAATVLTRTNQLDMYGVPDSGGVWAPSLTYHDDKFWLIYSNMKEHRAFKDVHNYLVTCDEIDGDWSDPVFLNSSGFDPSLFHNEDGKKYMLNLIYDYRNYNPWYGGIAIQEYSVTEQKLMGEKQIIFTGTDLGKTEGPNLFYKDGYYYLVTAEGGTKYEHAVTLARATSIYGPYEVHPENPILSTWSDPRNHIQKAGHADFIQTDSGEWYMTYLMARPIKRKGKSILEERGFCPLGRETSLAKIYWENDWPYVQGGRIAQIEVPAPKISTTEGLEPTIWDGNFSVSELPSEFQTLRVPFNETMGTLSQRPGYLRLIGGESLYSVFQQSLVARRFESLNFTVVTQVEFEPDNFQQMAGITCFYNTKNWISLYISHDDVLGRVIDIMQCEGQVMDWPLKKNKIPLDDGPIYMKVVVTPDKLSFYFSQDNQDWIKINKEVDTYKLSDDYIAKPFTGSVGSAFTGSFIGLHCNDLSGGRKSADFKFFNYIEEDTNE